MPMEVRKDTDEKVMIGNSETAECHSLLLLFLQIPDDSASIALTLSLVPTQLNTIKPIDNLHGSINLV